jgi:hypothetical protein
MIVYLTARSEEALNAAAAGAGGRAVSIPAGA